MTVRTRFAPSPTGRLHLGNVRAAAFNWLLARISREMAVANQNRPVVSRASVSPPRRVSSTRCRMSSVKSPTSRVVSERPGKSNWACPPER